MPTKEFLRLYREYAHQILDGEDLLHPDVGKTTNIESRVKQKLYLRISQLQKSTNRYQFQTIKNDPKPGKSHS